MKLVVNAEAPRNHRAVLMEYASGADELLILSPFLAPDVGRVLREPSLARITRFRFSPRLSRTRLFN